MLMAACWFNGIAAVELTFELPDNAKECFYEEIEKGTASSLEFQVSGDGCSSLIPVTFHSCLIPVILFGSRCTYYSG